MPNDAELLRRGLSAAFGAALPGHWEAVDLGAEGHSYVCRVASEGSGWPVTNANKLEDARVMAAGRNAIGRLFAALDAESTGARIVGDVLEAGPVTWRSCSSADSR